MTIKQFVFSPFQENTYVISTEHKLAMILDPGCFSADEERKLQGYIESEGLEVVRLVNTHLHLDHIFGNAFVEKTWNVVTEACIGDANVLENYESNCSRFGITPPSKAPTIGIILKEGDQIRLGDDIFDIYEVPGHSPGSIILHHAAEGHLFVGDVLFKGSIGRTDLEDGNYEQLIKGIQEKILVLQDETIVYSGHGPTTTIGNERINNPFL